jgi:hypothetical protein
MNHELILQAWREEESENEAEEESSIEKKNFSFHFHCRFTVECRALQNGFSFNSLNNETQ